MSDHRPPQHAESVTCGSECEVFSARTLWALTVENTSSYFERTLLPSRPCHRYHNGVDDDNTSVQRIDSEVAIFHKVQYARLLDMIARKYVSGYWGRLYDIAAQLRLQGKCFHDMGAYPGSLPLPVRDDAKLFALRTFCEEEDDFAMYNPPIEAKFSLACDSRCPSPSECWVKAITEGIRYPPPPLDDWTEEEIFDLRQHFYPHPFDDRPTLDELHQLEETLKKNAESSIAEGEAALKEHESSAAFQLECDCPFPMVPFDAPEHTDSASVVADDAMDVDSSETPALADASSPTLAEAIRLETQLTQEALDVEYAEDELVLREFSRAFEEIEEIWGSGDAAMDGPVSPITPLPSPWLDQDTPESDWYRDASVSESESEESFRSCEVFAASADKNPDRAQVTLSPPAMATSTDNAANAEYWRQQLLDERDENNRALQNARELVRGAERSLKRALEIIDDASTQPSKRSRLQAG